MNTGSCPITVVIKALNEEARIAAAIESALKAVANMGGEVVLADSCSTDRTVEIAMRYPIRIVQLAHANERCCGVGPQLGFQHALGDYVYLMDGDMQLLPGFLERALNFLAQHPEVAGIGGRVVEENLESLEYRERSQRVEAHRAPGSVDRLDGGGLYRRRAILEVGWFSDRNLHSYEELDLAVRLRSRGWKLWRVGVDAVSHRGHDAPPYHLLRRRWSSGYICGAGELLRGAMGNPWLRLVWRDQRELRLYLGVLAWWALSVATLLVPVAWSVRAVAFGALLLAPLAVMSLRKRSLQRGLYSVVSWCFHAAGLVRGLVRRRRAPDDAIASRILREPGEPTAQQPGWAASQPHDCAPPPSAQRS